MCKRQLHSRLRCLDIRHNDGLRPEEFSLPSSLLCRHKGDTTTDKSADPPAHGRSKDTECGNTFAKANCVSNTIVSSIDRTTNTAATSAFRSRHSGAFVVPKNRSERFSNFPSNNPPCFASNCGGGDQADGKH